MTSKDMGVITMANDIPGLVLIGFVSYFGEHGNKVKWLGYGALITGKPTELYYNRYLNRYY